MKKLTQDQMMEVIDEALKTPAEDYVGDEVSCDCESVWDSVREVKQDD